MYHIVYMYIFFCSEWATVSLGRNLLRLCTGEVQSVPSGFFYAIRSSSVHAWSIRFVGNSTWLLPVSYLTTNIDFSQFHGYTVLIFIEICSVILLSVFRYDRRIWPSMPASKIESFTFRKLVGLITWTFRWSICVRWPLLDRSDDSIITYRLFQSQCGSRTRKPNGELEQRLRSRREQGSPSSMRYFRSSR